ncbi:MAG: hypothetical protein AABP62_02415 [Planctomycetota bacterium]
MSQSHFRTLMKKQIDGTLTDGEDVQLREMLRQWSRDRFDICPACGGAFSLEIRMNDCVHCPLCETQLLPWSSDICGHHDDEIDPALPESEFLGEFTAGYSFPGVIACLQCGILYPKAYTCCPRLFSVAIQYSGSGAERERMAAVRFIDLHSETFLNVLRSKFRTELDHRHIELLQQIVPFAKRGLEIGTAAGVGPPTAGWHDQRVP